MNNWSNKTLERAYRLIWISINYRASTFYNFKISNEQNFTFKFCSQNFLLSFPACCSNCDAPCCKASIGILIFRKNRKSIYISLNWPIFAAKYCIIVLKTIFNLLCHRVRTVFDPCPALSSRSSSLCPPPKQKANREYVYIYIYKGQINMSSAA